MRSKIIMQRLIDRFNPSEDWDEETEIYTPSDLPTINKTVYICPKCGIHNYLKDNSCIKCDRQLI